MLIYNSLLLPFLFGLIGFVEPCSLGINMMVLSALEKANVKSRLGELVVFALIRALLLASIGISIAFLGSWLFPFQRGYFLILGGIYIAVGGLMIFSQSWLKKIRDIRIARWLGVDLRDGSIKRLGIVAGLTIPACAIPLLTVLLGQSLLSGDLISGFIGLFVFGFALTFPLIIFSFFNKGRIWLNWFAQRSQQLRIIGGLVLIVIGAMTLYSSTYWAQALSSL